MAKQSNISTARREARLPLDFHALLERAAELHGQTLTDFEVTAARDAACRRIEEAEIIRISVEHQRLLFPSCFAIPRSPHLLWAAHSGDAILFLLRSGSAGSLLPTPGAARCPPPCRYRLVAVAAFYTLASPSIPKPVLPLEATKRLPRYPSIPAVSIGRLTVALNFQGRGLGAALLADALRQILSSPPAFFAFLVDAKADRASQR